MPINDEFNSNLPQTIPINASNRHNITTFSDYFQNQPQSKLQHFENEIKINIFKYINHPLNLALTCRDWSVVAKNPHAKTEWFLEHYGKSNALFHTVRLGPTFVDVALWQILIAKKVISSINALNRIVKLPRQAVNDPLSIDQFFNGSSFT